MRSDLEHFKRFTREFARDGRHYFDDGEIFTARAPGRLDVMGGIADYSGSLVLEMPIAEATYAAVQVDPEPVIRIVSLRQDLQLRAGQGTGQGLRAERAVSFEMPLVDFTAARSAADIAQNGAPAADLAQDGSPAADAQRAAAGLDHRPIDYAAAERYFRRDAGNRWAAYIAGAFLVLMREAGAVFERGARILVRSDVPESVGVSSSAALEVATMRAICRAYGIEIDRTELARLCQVVENRVAGAPCGIMDQMTSVHGQPGRLLALLCRPAQVRGYVDIPGNLRFWGIDSGIRHAVSGSDYGGVRVGAFMGLKIIQSISGQDYGGYLTNITPAEFERVYRRILPESLKGADFRARYGELPDPVSVVDPEREYAVLQPTQHPIYEHARVQKFAALLKSSPSDAGKQMGELMYESHASYSACGLGSEGTDLLVDMVREVDGLYGAKITGGGSGGTVAVLGSKDTEAAVMSVAAAYQRQTGHGPYVFGELSEGNEEAQP